MIRRQNALPEPIPTPKRVYTAGGSVNALPPLSKLRDDSLPEEGYRIVIDPDCAVVKASTDRGFHWANVTLSQYTALRGSFPLGVIEDEPTYRYRGVLFDCSRHFFDVEDVKKVIDAASLFKINRFHWHLTDDQGWRIESAVFPKLTEIGSRRKGSHFGRHHSYNEYGGFYTRDDIRSVVEYASERGMDVVPEIEMPGHASSILAVYPEFSCSGAPVEVRTRPGVFEDVLCPGKDSVLDFVDKLLEEIVPLFSGEYFHIGGDESPSTHWKTCPDCRRRIADLGLGGLAGLREWFSDRVAKKLISLGKKPIVWNDVLSDEALLNAGTVVQYWFGDKALARAHSSRGGSVILSEVPYCYTDYSYAQSPLKKFYSYDPEAFGLPFPALGIESTIWSSYVSDIDRVGFMLFPRAAATAEIAWNGSVSRETFGAFTDAFERLLPMFGAIGLKPASISRVDPSGLMRGADFARFWAENATPAALRSDIGSVLSRLGEKKG